MLLTVILNWIDTRVVILKRIETRLTLTIGTFGTVCTFVTIGFTSLSHPLLMFEKFAIQVEISFSH